MLASNEEKINNFYKILKNVYPTSYIPMERQIFLGNLMKKYGYIPYPYIKALEELSNQEVLFCIEKKWENEGVFKNGNFSFEEISVLARNNVADSSWIKREGHDIKLITLAGHGNRNKKQNTAIFINWLRQLVILPTGNIQNNIYNTTIYLTPFHTRGYHCAYIPDETRVSPLLGDESLCKLAGIDADEQVQIFIQMAQLAGHPVIYDILPQTGRFSKIVLTNPECVRWYDLNSLIEQLNEYLDNAKNNPEGNFISDNIYKKYASQYLNEAIDFYKNIIKYGDKKDIPLLYKDILADIENDEKLIEYKKKICNKMQNRENQKLIQQQVRSIVLQTIKSSSEKIEEADIQDRKELENILINEGLWPICGGAWCSSGVPIFDKMSINALYPIFRHYNYKEEDVSRFSNLDCQAPFYFVYLENGEINQDCADFYIEYIKQLQNKFNFDGFRIDHCDHIVDEFSEQNGKPISYRIPRVVLKTLNNELKKQTPYFAIIAEYMLWNSYYKEYHQDMNFDVLWGSDIVSQSYKTPSNIQIDNQFLSDYNCNIKDFAPLSILKMYNNQDSENAFIDRYPSQLEKEGALFKWFKYKFFPGGLFAQRPMLYIDGDESFTKKGLSISINREAAIKRNRDYDFFAKFDAIDRFVKNNKIICDGKAKIIHQGNNGFVLWQIENEAFNDSILVAANYNSPKEKFITDDNVNKQAKYIIGVDVLNQNIVIPQNFVVTSEFKFNGQDYVEEPFKEPKRSLNFKLLKPAEFKFFNLKKL